MARQRRTGGGPASGEPAWRRFLDRISLPGIEAWSTTLRTVFINLVFLIAILVVFPVLISQFRRDQVIIEPIAVPETLAAQGLTPEVAANRLWDGLHDVKEAAHTTKETIDTLPDARRVEFSFPDSGFSIESLVFHLRRLFDAYETRVAGEFVCAAADCERSGVRLRLRIVRDRVDIVDLGPIGERAERDYFREAATGVLSELDPFVALAATADAEPLKATILARHLIRSRHKDAKWAHNLIGLIRMEQSETVAAIAEYRAALELDPAFLPARTNLGFALLASQDLAGAKQAFEETRRRDPTYVFALEGLADVAVAAGDRADAVKLLLAAADLAPLDPRYFAKAGRIEMEAGNTADGTGLLTRALELDPGYFPAFTTLALMHMNAGDNGKAEKLYRDAADYAPQDPEAQAAHGMLLAIVKDWQGSADRYKRAMALQPSNAVYRYEYARALQRLDRNEEALAELEKAGELDPLHAGIWMSRGDSLRDLGRTAEAVAAYRRYLELEKDDAAMRQVVEQLVAVLSG